MGGSTEEEEMNVKKMLKTKTKVKGYGRLPWAVKDSDKDGVKNILDCKPYDKNQQGLWHQAKAWVQEKRGDTEGAGRTREEGRRSDEIKREVREFKKQEAGERAYQEAKREREEREEEREYKKKKKEEEKKAVKEAYYSEKKKAAVERAKRSARPVDVAKEIGKTVGQISSGYKAGGGMYRIKRVKKKGKRKKGRKRAKTKKTIVLYGRTNGNGVVSRAVTRRPKKTVRKRTTVRKKPKKNGRKAAKRIIGYKLPQVKINY